MDNITERIERPEQGELDLNVSEKKSETSEMQQSDKTLSTSNPSRPGDFFKNLFRRDQNPSRTSEKVRESNQDKIKLSKKEDDQLYCGAGENISKQNTHSGLDLNVSEMSFSETHTAKTGRTRGFSCPTKGFEDQKPTESKSALTVEEPAPNDEQKEPEPHVQRDDLNNKFDQEDNKDMNVKTETEQTEKRTINPFTFLKEELLKVFKDKNTDLEPEDCLSIQMQNDVNIKEDEVNISSSKDMDMSSDSKTTWTAEKSSNHLKILKDDPSDVAGIYCLKEKEVKEDSSKKTEQETERTNENITNQFKRDQKLLKISEKVDNCQESTLTEKKDEHQDCAFWGNCEEKNEEKFNAEKIKDRKDQPEDKELVLNVSIEKPETSFSKTQQSDEMMCTSNQSRPGGFFKNLFRRDQKPIKTSDKENKPEVIIMVSEKKDTEVDSVVRGNLSDQNEDKKVRDRMNQPEESELVHMNVSEEESASISFSATRQSGEMMSTSNTNGPTDFSCSAAGLGDQKPRKSKSALIVKEPSQKNNHRESETCLQEYELTHKQGQTKDLKTNQREKGFNALALLKEDLFKVFQDKHTKSEPEDHPLRLTQSLPTGSTLNLLKEDLSHSKEDINFNVSSSKDKDMKSSDWNTSQAGGKSDNHLSLLFDSSKIPDPIAERANKPFTNLFERDQKLVKTFEKVEGYQDATLLEKKEEPLDSGLKKNLIVRDEENLTAKTANKITEGIDQPQDGELDLKVSEKKSERSFSEKQQSNETTCTSNTSRPGGIFKKLFGRDQKPEKLQDTQEVNHMCSQKKEEQLCSGFMGNLTEKNRADNVTDKRNQPKQSELDINVSNWTTFSEIQKNEMTYTMKTGQPTGFSHPTTGFEVQKPTGAKSPLIGEEPSQEKGHKEPEMCLEEDDLTHKFDQKDNKEKNVNQQDFLETNQREKRTTSPLILFKEDLSQFKDDLLSVFRISPSKEKDNKQDSSQTEVPVAEDTKEPFKEDEELDSDRGNLSEQEEEALDTEDMMTKQDRKDQPQDSELDLNTFEDKSEKSFPEVQQSEETMFIFDTGRDTTEGEKTNVDEEDKPSETLPWDLSKISLLSLRNANKDNMRGEPGGELWSPKNFATYLTFDPNTANSELLLMDANRKATRYWLDHRYLDHPERFQCCPQVLCREGLLDSVYWEVEWSGGADIGVAYNSISRDGDTSSCLLGHNERSWSLECSEGSYTPCYNKRRYKAFSPEPFTHRVGVYLDWSAGNLSFYCVSQDTMVHLHTFTSTFTEPLYAGFWIWAYKGSVSLCQVELGWEQLK